MRAESAARSIKMLKAILDGKTYVAVAQESGLSRSAIEQRVKALARDLQSVVGVERVDEAEVPTVKGMRARKDNYLEALEHYRPQRVINADKRTRALAGEDIERAVAMTLRTARRRCPADRDCRQQRPGQDHRHGQHDAVSDHAVSRRGGRARQLLLLRAGVLAGERQGLVWEHGGLRYRSQLVFRLNGKKKTEAFLHVRRGDSWRPMRLDDGTVSDGKVDTYVQCVEGILGSAETFFTSVFAAQGRRQSSAYKNGEIKTLLADLLGLDEIRALGAKALETAKLLKAGFTVRQELAAMADVVMDLEQFKNAQQGDANPLT
jgi:uncharacterized protein YerC